jgi:DNA-binding FrmR family transcriptional regulator
MKNENAIKRLKTIEGHLKGISKMAENGEYCIDLIRQIQAVQGALNKVSAALLDDHLNSCVITAIRGDDISERERVLREIAEIYEQAAKV